MTIYRNIPSLYNFDNYDHCLSQNAATYCVVFAEIEANNKSNVWLNIEKLSRDLFHHFRHENLFFGVCMDKCKQLLDNLTSLEIQRYGSNKTLENEVNNLVLITFLKYVCKHFNYFF